MGTEVLRVLDRNALREELERAGSILRAGGLVAFPTETVYGIAVSAEDPVAIERLYELKQRPRNKPLSMMVADIDVVRRRCPDLSPSHPLAQGLVEAAGVPLLVPSANISGAPPATTAEEVLAQFPDQLDLVIDGGPAQAGVESTVVEVRGDEVTILREGAIPEWRIRQPEAAGVLFVCTGNTDRSPLAAAILKRRLANRLGCPEDELEARGYRIESAGMVADDGERASRRIRAVARDDFDPPLELDGHRSRKLTAELLQGATRVICMERAQREEILAFFPERVRDVMLLDPEGNDIEDPAGQNLAAYRRLAKRLDAAAVLIAGSLLQ
jgi:tRNA A37 threonylcarbamoyladenosine synthetase subunit TsaC/SUA5/YrdC/protein-tyrosine-phosphatase